jgi:hypothetical protein
MRPADPAAKDEELGILGNANRRVSGVNPNSQSPEPIDRGPFRTLRSADREPALEEHLGQTRHATRRDPDEMGVGWGQLREGLSFTQPIHRRSSSVRVRRDRQEPTFRVPARSCPPSNLNIGPFGRTLTIFPTVQTYPTRRAFRAIATGVSRPDSREPTAPRRARLFFREELR